LESWRDVRPQASGLKASPARWKEKRKGGFYSLSLWTPVTAVVMKRKERTDSEKSNQNINDAILGARVGFYFSHSLSSFTTPTIYLAISLHYLTEDSVRFIDVSFLHSAAVDAEMLLLGSSGVFTTG
jgi:hypothetical protein